MNITLFWKDKMIFKGFEYLLGKVAENYFWIIWMFLFELLLLFLTIIEGYFN